MIDMEQQEYRINFCCVVIFRICLYFVCTYTHTLHRGEYTEILIHVMCIYLFCILVNHFRLFMLHFAHAHVYARTLTHTRPQLQLLQAFSNMRFCLHSYVCMQACVVVCRTRPTFCIFLFWYRFQNKTTHFPRCKRNSDSDSDFFFFLLSLSFYSRAFFLRRNFTTFALLTLCIQFYSFILPLLVNFILHLARAPTHTAYRTHTHAR